MITAWRTHWDAADAPQPFIFFQLGPWPDHDTGAIAAQRQAQTGALALPQVGMVVAADRGDSAGAFHPIHPPTKEELSHRAFLGHGTPILKQRVFNSRAQGFGVSHSAN